MVQLGRMSEIQHAPPPPNERNRSAQANDQRHAPVAAALFRSVTGARVPVKGGGYEGGDKRALTPLADMDTGSQLSGLRCFYMRICEFRDDGRLKGLRSGRGCGPEGAAVLIQPQIADWGPAREPDRCHGNGWMCRILQMLPIPRAIVDASQWGVGWPGPGGGQTVLVPLSPFGGGERALSVRSTGEEYEDEDDGWVVWQKLLNHF